MIELESPITSYVSATDGLAKICATYDFEPREQLCHSGHVNGDNPRTMVRKAPQMGVLWLLERGLDEYEFHPKHRQHVEEVIDQIINSPGGMTPDYLLKEIKNLLFKIVPKKRIDYYKSIQC